MPSVALISVQINQSRQLVAVLSRNLLTLLLKNQFNKLHNFLQEDPLQQGYSRVNQSAGSGGDGTLSNSTTSTSLDTVVIDTSTDNISNSPKLHPPQQRTFSPILEAEDTTNTGSNPFAEDFKELASRAKKSNLKCGGKITFEEEENDRFDEGEEAFKNRREHFQKTKSRSEHKSILIRVSLNLILIEFNINLKFYFRI